MGQQVFETKVEKVAGVEYIVRVYYDRRGEDPYQIKLQARRPGNNFFSTIQTYGELDRSDAEQFAKELLEHAVNERL